MTTANNITERPTLYERVIKLRDRAHDQMSTISGIDNDAHVNYYTGKYHAYEVVKELIEQEASRRD